MDITERLAEIQKTLKAPKSQFNSFGKYSYRNQEDILEAVKPLLGGCALVVGDEIVSIGDRVYVKATATLMYGEAKLSNTAYAREPVMKKGMDESQITGAASSYARKYALGGLFLADDTKDADSTNNHKPNKHQEWAALLIGYKQAKEDDALLTEFEAKDNDFVAEAWKYLNSTDRAQIKKIIEQEREARKNG